VGIGRGFRVQKVERRGLRGELLAAFGAKGPQIEELLEYNENVFEQAPAADRVAFPLPNEPFVAAWERYLEAARVEGALPVLQRALVQLNYPVREGISEEPAYRAVVRRGEPVGACPLATGLGLHQPERIQLTLRSTPAGSIGVIAIGDRRDFESVVRALTRRNEPAPIPRSMGATMIAGFNNWDRIGEYKRRWSEGKSDRSGSGDWASEFKWLITQRELYQDRFIIVSEGPYSGVSAQDLGLDEEEWIRLSLAIRLNHECTHYFTKRVFDSMRNNLLDEIIADYVGIVAAIGRYRADWFLHFVGLEAYPAYRSGGRLDNYRGDPPLSDGSFRILQHLVEAAARNLERFDADLEGRRTLRDRGRLISGLARMTLEEMASPTAKERFAEVFGEA
jgi:hypothetical protein